jgi:antitoxin component YwqK of YwqJK toxin-antitoxin module
MKLVLISLFCLISFTASAQKIPGFGFYKVRIALPDKTILAEINPSSNPSVKSNLFYYWYEANVIHNTQGGFSGKLLNGSYIEYYPNKNLKEQGTFKKGLKTGAWKSWNEDGTLAINSIWKNGILLSGKKAPIWKRLNIFRKKYDHSAVDTLKK